MFWLDTDLGIIFCKQSVLTPVKAQFYLEFALFTAPFMRKQSSYIPTSQKK
jgi:hypothetical protein